MDLVAVDCVGKKVFLLCFGPNLSGGMVGKDGGEVLGGIGDLAIVFDVELLFLSGLGDEDIFAGLGIFPGDLDAEAVVEE